MSLCIEACVSECMHTSHWLPSIYYYGNNRRKHKKQFNLSVGDNDTATPGCMLHGVKVEFSKIINQLHLQIYI